jgi:hypothetical protein
MPKGVESIKYEGVSFNKQAAAGMTLAEFQEHESHHGLSEAQLKEAWQLARGTKEEVDVKLGAVEVPGGAESEETPQVNASPVQSEVTSSAGKKKTR